MLQTLDDMQLGSRDHHTPLQACIHVFLFSNTCVWCGNNQRRDRFFWKFHGEKISIMFSVIIRKAMDLVKIFCLKNLKAFRRDLIL